MGLALLVPVRVFHLRHAFRPGMSMVVMSMWVRMVMLGMLTPMAVMTRFLHAVNDLL